MKKIILLATTFMLASSVFAQINQEIIKTTQQPANIRLSPAKPIPAEKAIIIRRNFKMLLAQATQLNDSARNTKTYLDQVAEKMKNNLDSLSEMGEMESLRLQMAMDRMSKVMTTISNILKKIDDTSDGIVQNLK